MTGHQPVLGLRADMDVVVTGEAVDARDSAQHLDNDAKGLGPAVELRIEADGCHLHHAVKPATAK